MMRAAPGTSPPDTRIPPLSDEEFLSRFGDTIDDRVAEILDELLQQRRMPREEQRAPWRLFTVIVLAALVWSIVLAL